MEYTSFDIETSGSIEEPSGITCAATMLCETGPRQQRSPPVLWYGETDEETGLYADKMSAYLCRELVEYLAGHHDLGYPTLAWNGVSFDFRVLAEQCESREHYQKCIELAKESYDPMFQMVNRKGFGVGLNKAAIGMGVGGKLEGMDGHKAVEMWGDSREAQEIVLKYVAQDVIATANVFDALLRTGMLRWLSSTGKFPTWVPLDSWQPVKMFINRHQNEAHWSATIKEIFKQERFTAWMDKLPT